MHISIYISIEQHTAAPAAVACSSDVPTGPVGGALARPARRAAAWAGRGASAATAAAAAVCCFMTVYIYIYIYIYNNDIYYIIRDLCFIMKRLI